MKFNLQESLRDSLLLSRHYASRASASERYDEVLRTPSLRPSAGDLVNGLMESHRTGANHHEKSLGVFVAAKRDLAKEIAREDPAEAVQIENALILRTRIGVCLGDALIPKETSGFIAPHEEWGSEELPPWDTWIGVAQEGGDVGLLSCVPEWGKAIVEKAIAADYLGMYSWYRVK